MNDQEFDRLAMKAFAPESELCERVWSKSRRPRRTEAWLPTFGELSFALAVGAAALFVLALWPAQKSQPVVRRESPSIIAPEPGVAATYIAVSQVPELDIASKKSY